MKTSEALNDRQGVRLLRVALVGSLGCFWGYRLLAPASLGTSWGLDHILFHLPIVFGLVACFVRWRKGGNDDAPAWLALGAAHALFLLGSLYVVVFTSVVIDLPSLADAFWMLSYVSMYTAIALFTRTRIGGSNASSWLDGAIGGFGASALVITFVLADVMAVTGGLLPVVIVNLAYPVADLILVLLLVVVGMGVTAVDRVWWLVGTGLTLFFVGDVAYLYKVTAQEYVGLGIIELTWPTGVVLMGFAATLRPAEVVSRSAMPHRYLVPALFSCVALTLLVHGQRHDLPYAAVIFAVITIGLAVARIALTARELRTMGQFKSEARTDFLTGLPNRRHLFEQLHASTGFSPGPTSLLVIDLDGFKEVNDSLGHSAGDQLLCMVGTRLSTAVEPPATLARLGGDEFAVVLPGQTSDAAAATAEALRTHLQTPFQLEGLPITVNASIGVATAPEHARTAARILACADIALYQAKAHGREVATFRHDADNPSRERLELMGELSLAFDREEFTVFYQPQLGLANRRVFGVEALVRWNHPARGTLPPGSFLPLIRHSGQMAKLTHFVLNRAVADLVHFRERGHQLRLSVNISALDLSSMILPPLIAELTSRWDLDPGRIALEVTEDDVISDLALSRKVLTELRRAGALVSVDDYGTGRASLAYLRDLPLDEIKLDRSFLSGGASDLHNAAIVRSTIELAHALHLPVVAEGIEDSGTLEWLSGLGCAAGQGFFISRPRPQHDILDWLSRHHDW